MTRYLQGTCNQTELVQVRKYLNNEQYMFIWREVIDENVHEEIELEPTSDNQRIKKDIYKRITSQRKPVKTSPFRSLDIAAVLFMICGISYLCFYSLSKSDSNIRYIATETGPGQRTQLSLADGSTVYLHALSKIRFPEQFNNASREVEFTGEGFFEIKSEPKRPFLIKLNDLQVKVLGTSFDINNFDHRTTKISVNTGKVEVSRPDSIDGLKFKILGVLNPDQKLVYDHANHLYEIKKVNAGNISAWKDGVLNFENQTLEDVSKNLERWYGVEIEFQHQEIRSCMMTAKFKDVSLRFVLDALTMISELEYELNDKKVLIKGKKCN